jgi:hypothetical protein
MIVHVYDTEPENTSKIMALMQENQEYVRPLYSYIRKSYDELHSETTNARPSIFLPYRYGELPTEFTKEICPGLEFDANGLPKMSPDGNPFGGNEDCRIM